MRKRVLLFVALFMFLYMVSFSIVSAQNTTKVNDAYSCLREEIDMRTCSELSSEERFFSLLATGKCRDEVASDSVNNECWPASGCGIKSTAQAILALDSVDRDTSDAENWLLPQKATPDDMVWYLQIESNDPTTCTLTYDDNSYTVSIGEGKKINHGAGSCLSLSSNSYWLEVSSSEQLGCYEKEFEISCDQSFLTTLLFTRSGSATIHVSEKTTSASAEGATIEKIDSFCFSTGFRCDYEGSLWAALVLDSLEHDISAFLPYLITMAEDNERYLPEAFLYLLTGDTDYRTRLLLKQKANKYWRESGDRFYDTALALYPFQYEEPVEKTNSQNWLLSKDIQGEDGCWEGNIRNTAFILYSIWPKTLPGDGGNGNGDAEDDCEDREYSCRLSSSCSADQGEILNEYNCAGTYVCCSVEPVSEFCEDIGGQVCDSDERCVGGTIDTTPDLSHGQTCCIGGICETGGAGPGGFCTGEFGCSGLTYSECTSTQGCSWDTGGGEADCEIYEGICRSYNCGSDEEESVYRTCDSGQVCCVEKDTPGLSSGKKTAIWILFILIILLVFGIVFKDKLRKLLFRFKPSGRSRKPGFGRGPFRPGPGPPPAPLTGRPEKMPMPERMRPMRRRPGPRPRTRPPGELDDVLKKLKEMGK